MIRDSPVELDQPNKLVYSFHLYSWQGVTSYDTYENFNSGLYSEVGYILDEDQPYTAPLWLGEFGENNSSNYWKFLIRYLSEHETLGWSYWAWNGYKTTPKDDESFGIVNADMVTIRDDWKL